MIKFLNINYCHHNHNNYTQQTIQIVGGSLWREKLKRRSVVLVKSEDQPLCIRRAHPELGLCWDRGFTVRTCMPRRCTICTINHGFMGRIATIFPEIELLTRWILSDEIARYLKKQKFLIILLCCVNEILPVDPLLYRAVQIVCRHGHEEFSLNESTTRCRPS